MVAIDRTMQEATRRALRRAGGAMRITITRQTGAAPNVTTRSATITGVVRNYQIDSTEMGQEGFSASQIGTITQGDRQILVMADDLAGQGFPLPVLKNDTIVTEAGERMNVTRVDAAKRAIAGCIEIVAAGV